MASSPLTEPLYVLADAWRDKTRTPRRRALIVTVSLVWVAAILAARQGSVCARAVAVAAMGASLAGAVVWKVVERRRLRRPESIVRNLVRGLDRERGDRALRALALLGPDGAARAPGTSVDLAALHVARVVAQIPSRRVLEHAGLISRQLGAAALVGGLCLLALTFATSWSLLEGADVLVARGGAAPVTMRWLEDLDVEARPPEYLREGERRVTGLSAVALPRGTLITVRGTPTRAGRKLVLYDSKVEIPFADDGAGKVVARWPLAESATLRVTARFGDIIIGAPEALFVESIPDLAPEVVLEEAPRRISLVTQTDDIPLRYEATDDHGLREVHLVLRSGTREERRELARLDGQTKNEKGGSVLKLRDPFIKKSYAPIEVTVEAKDNDPVTGPKWGASAAITLVPPDVGEPEALRVESLRRVRDALVDSLAWRLANPVRPEDAPAKDLAAEDTKRAIADDDLLWLALATNYSGVRVPARVRAALVAQQESTHRAVDGQARAPSRATHAEVIKASERFVLVADAVVRGLGTRDARDSGRQLAEVADDLALGASQNESARSGATDRMDSATVVLYGGGRVIRRLGSLGRDLGEIVDADLLRVKRARDSADQVHAELAARDLAARLREPDPSFGSPVGRSRRGGGESGGGRGTPGEPGEDGSPSDEVDRALEEAASGLEQLAQDHAGEIGKMEQALAGATSQDETNELRQQAKSHAEAVREAARQLPSIGNGSDSWTSKGAAARELAEQMARSLEQAHPGDAVQSGRSAIGALDESKKVLQRGGWFEDPSGRVQRRVEDVRRKIEAEEKWAERELDQAHRRAGERARGELEQGGAEESKLAERARDIAQDSRQKGSLPQDAIDSIDDAVRAARQAAEALRKGDPDRGLERQREAQHHLEAASEVLRGDDDQASNSPGPRDDGEDRPTRQAHVNVPKPGEHKGPEEFRKRVVRGLGQPAAGGLKDAVRRYAEGLLR